MTGKISVGIVGLGVGESHLKEILSRNGFQVVMVCDRDATKLEMVSRSHGLLNSSTEALDVIRNPNVDLVVIASYDEFHFEQTLEALLAGKHVFVEKPVVQTPTQAEQLWECLRQRPQLLLTTNLVLRKYPRFLDLKNKIREGHLGKVFGLEADYLYGRLEKLTHGWRGRTPRYSVMLGGGIHMIDLTQWLLEERPTSVTAFGNRFCTEHTDFEQNDYIVAFLHYASGRHVKVSANFGCVHPHFHDVRVYGTQGTWIHRLDGVEIFKERGDKVRPSREDIPYPGVGKGGFWGDVLNALQERSHELVSKNEVFDSLSVGFAIEESLVTGQTTSVRYFYEV